MSEARSQLMSQTMDAVFEDGTFKPVNNGSLPFAEGQRVKLTVEVPPENDDNLIELAGQVYEGLSEEDIGEIERLALDRGNFFQDRPSS
jgi:predicted DNA-binding antitoxin AbrB/MazE fold protein